MPTPRIGRMKERLVLKQVTPTTDGAGGSTNIYTEISTIWGRAEVITAGKADEDGRIFMGKVVRFQVRFQNWTITDIDDFIITWNGENYNIHSAVNQGEQSIWMTIMAYRDEN